jgi:two-component system response regulator VicR
MIRKKILVVDDDAELLSILSHVLFEQNYHVIPSPNGEVTSYINEIKPDLILLDNKLAGTPGNELCKMIKSDPDTQHIPVVMVSAANDLENIALEAGADGFIQKPFDIGQVEAIVAKLIGQPTH